MIENEPKKKVVVPGTATPDQASPGQNKDPDVKESGKRGDFLYGTVVNK